MYGFACLGSKIIIALICSNYNIKYAKVEGKMQIGLLKYC